MTNWKTVKQALFLLVIFLLVSGVNLPQTFAAATEPYGLAAMQQFDRLPYLKLDTLGGQDSSYDRTGGNSDGFGASNYLYIDSLGDKVMMDLKGPGSIYCMWFTGFDWNAAYLKIYFDGEATPRLNMLLKDIFVGKNAPFLAPLVGTDNASSGGFYCYVPMPFAQSIKITTNGAGGSFFYHVGYHVYTKDTAVTTWTSGQDNTAVRDMWNRAGNDPKSDSGNTTVSGTTSLGAGATQTLLDTAGARSISSIKLRIPGVAAPNQTLITDDGRAHKGFSQFVMALNSGNTGVNLKRRLDYGIADQKANVYVDGAYAGQWFNAGGDLAYRWRDSDFNIPSTFTAGKSAITVKIVFVSSVNDWNEFYYWAYSNVSGVWTLTDTLDVGKTASESGHSYTINTQTWNSSNSFYYPPSSAPITDDGRAHMGYSQFVMALNVDNQGAFLKRRLAYWVADQKAAVYVNGGYVGEWFNAGSDGVAPWRDSSFYIPKSFTAGKTAVTVKIQFISAMIDWNEFYYWMYSITGDGKILTDSLDVGNSASELAHSYVINTPNWNGANTFSYLASSSDVNDILNNTWIRIYWNSEPSASVNAPIGSFFAMGQFGPYGTRSLPVGMDENNNMYIYFPMPFQDRAVVQLVSTRSVTTNNLFYEIKHKPFSGSFTDVGYFKTNFHSETPTTLGSDILILDVEGSGHFLGVVESMKGETNRWFLEGDERIYVDDSASPAYHGTGTEDFYNAGWYFNRELFTTPTHGNTAHVIDANDKTTAYRLFIHDCVPFRKHIRVGIEHGAANDAQEDVWTLAYYYHKPNARAIFTDTLDVGNAASESAHAYVINGQNWSGSRTYTYEGDFDNINVTDDGRAFTGYSEFTMAIQPSNQGVLLRRRFDQVIANQMANVYVDGSLVGTWYKAGSNGSHNWRDDDFMIPAMYTSGKSSIRIRVAFVSSALDVNEFRYWVWSLMGKSDTNNLAQTGSGRSAVYTVDHFGNALAIMTDGVKTGGTNDDSWNGLLKSEDYWGIAFDRNYAFNKAVYTTGLMFVDGGWFSSNLRAQVRQSGTWVNVTGLSITPAYPYNNTAGPNKSYKLTFNDTWGDAIRVVGVPVQVPGYSFSFTSVGELEIYYAVNP